MEATCVTHIGIAVKLALYAGGEAAKVKKRPAPTNKPNSRDKKSDR